MPSWPWTLILLFGWEGWSAKRCNVCHAFRTMTGLFKNRDVANWTHFGCKLKISWNSECCFIMLDWIQCFNQCSVGLFYAVRIGSKFFSRERRESCQVAMRETTQPPFVVRVPSWKWDWVIPQTLTFHRYWEGDWTHFVGGQQWM